MFFLLRPGLNASQTLRLSIVILRNGEVKLSPFRRLSVLATRYLKRWSNPTSKSQTCSSRVPPEATVEPKAGVGGGMSLTRIHSAVVALVGRRTLLAEKHAHLISWLQLSPNQQGWLHHRQQ